MFEVSGKYNTAKVFSDRYDEKSVGQIIELCNQEFVEGSKIRIMPDYHYGAGCTIGFTADLKDKVVPNLIGVDIGCGIFVTNLGNVDIDLKLLDKIIHEKVPSGRNNHDSPLMNGAELKAYTYGNFRIDNLICWDHLKKKEEFAKALGSLGGGNHFIEVNVGEDGNKYLVVHSGSRNVGKQVSDYYQRLAVDNCKGMGSLEEKKSELIRKYKENNKHNLIQRDLLKLEKDFRKAQPKYPKNLCFLEGRDLDNYIYDMRQCELYAYLNRRMISDIILKNLLNKTTDFFGYFNTTHNFISPEDNIIRKGAVMAYKNMPLIIPLNMRDGSLLCIGKGNEDWNYSAPHGAGRLMSRGEAKRTLKIDDFEESMQDVYTTSVNTSTLDESPQAYKPMQEIIDAIQDTVRIENIIKPIYNYKNSEEK